MTQLDKLIEEFILNPNNDYANYNLGREYHKIGQTASAVSFYLKCAEITDDDTLAYECLLLMSCCYETQGGRPETVKGMIKQALNLLPKRPEAYFALSKFYINQTNWSDAYTYSSLALEMVDFDVQPLRSDVGYHGKKGIEYQKAYSSWWWGKVDQSLDLFLGLQEPSSAQEKLYTHNDKMVTSQINRCDCYWCQRYPFPRLTEVGGKFWFEIPKNGSSSIKETFKDFKHLGKSEYPKDISPIVVFDDPVNRFVSLMNDYFCNPNRVNDSLHSSPNNLYGEDLFKTLGVDLYQTSDVEKVDIVLKNINKITSRHQVHHFYPQSAFVDTKFYSKFYVMLKKDINSVFGIDKVANKSVKTLKVEDLSEKQVAKIKEIYASDYEFYEKYATNKDPKIVQSKPVTTAEKFQSNPTPVTFQLGNSVRKSAIIIDNFYDDPDSVREFALNQKYVEGGIGRGFIGRRSENQFLFDGLKEKFESYIGEKITKWEEYGMNGRFQIAWSGEPLVYHCDSQRWGGMLYLSPDAPYQCGTTLWADKVNRSRTWFDEGWDRAWRGVSGNSHLDGTHFEHVDVLGNVYNRLVLFDGSCIHSASEYFGTDSQNGRLWQMFFFDT